MSNIDPTVPIYGKPTTQSVRTNFQYAHDEITTLQNWSAQIGNGPFALKGGDTFTGPVLLSHATPTAANEAASKSYVDSRGGTMTSITAGTGLSGGTITASGTIAVIFGNTVGTVTQGNDNRFSTIPGPSNAAPPANGTAAIGSSTLYARQDHSHPSDTSRVAKAGDTMTGALVAPGVNVTGNGIQYKFSPNIMGFAWNGNVNCLVDGAYQGDIAFTTWVQNGFKPASAYTPNQNVDTTASPSFWDTTVGGTLHVPNGAAVSQVDGQLNVNNLITFQSAGIGGNGCIYRAYHGYNAFAFADVGGGYTYAYMNSGAIGSLVPASTAAIKRNITPSDYDSLDAVLRTPLFSYKFIGSEVIKPVGFIAENQHEVYPESVLMQDESPWGIDIMTMVATLFGAVQQLTKRLEQLESKQ